MRPETGRTALEHYEVSDPLERGRPAFQPGECSCERLRKLDLSVFDPLPLTHFPFYPSSDAFARPCFSILPSPLLESHLLIFAIFAPHRARPAAKRARSSPLPRSRLGAESTPHPGGGRQVNRPQIAIRFSHAKDDLIARHGDGIGHPVSKNHSLKTVEE